LVDFSENSGRLNQFAGEWRNQTQAKNCQVYYILSFIIWFLQGSKERQIQNIVFRKYNAEFNRNLKHPYCCIAPKGENNCLKGCWLLAISF